MTADQTGPDDAAILRAGAAAMRSVVGPEAWAIPLIAAGLEADADSLDRGEHVETLTEALDLARTFIEETS